MRPFSKSYIDPQILISEPLPDNITYIIGQLQQYDDQNQPDLYFDLADDLWVNAKNAYAAGIISHRTWDLLTQKYIIYAEAAARKGKDNMQTKIYDLNPCRLSDRNGTYGGNSGDKEGIFIHDDYWLVKYPRSTRDLTGVDSMSYTTSPLSEYIGSHIYGILGYDVHETILGIRNGKVVVACKDLCDDEHRLIEFRQLKNTYNQQLSEELDTTLHSTLGDHFSTISEIMIHLKYNPELQNIPGLQERFWDCIIIDGLMNNNDRNNGNWGILRSKTESLLAPVYDNGSSFSPNAPEDRILHKMTDRQAFVHGVMHGVTAYSLDGKHNAEFHQLLEADIPQIKDALVRVVPKVREHLQECCDMIRSIPNLCGSLEVISQARQVEYIQELQSREELVLEPAYEKAMGEQKKERSADISKHEQQDDPEDPCF